MSFRNTLFAISLCLFGMNHAYATDLTQALDAMIQKRLPHASVGVVIQDLETDEILYQKNPNQLFMPASISKLYIAAASLYQLSPDYRYQTTLSQKDTNFYITFTGAPDFTSSDLSSLLEYFKKTNIKTIQGDIILDVSCFTPPAHSDATTLDDLGWYYAAPVTALILNENAAAYQFKPAKKIGEKISILPTQTGNALKIINDVKTVSEETAKTHCQLHLKRLPHNQIQLYGCLASSPEIRHMNLSIPDPIYFAKQTIASELKNAGITLEGHIKTGITPEQSVVRITHDSKPLPELLTHLLQTSDNLYANSLFKLLGFLITGEGSYTQGAFALQQILGEHTHLDMQLTTLSDGAGGRYNLVTPWQTAILLKDLYTDKTLRPIIFKALPVSGISGNLNERLKETPLEGKIFAKTGSMHDVSGLAGYLNLNEKKHLSFVIMINGVHTPIINAKKLEEEILQYVYVCLYNYMKNNKKIKYDKK